MNSAFLILNTWDYLIPSNFCARIFKIILRSEKNVLKMC